MIASLISVSLESSSTGTALRCCSASEKSSSVGVYSLMLHWIEGRQFHLYRH